MNELNELGTRLEYKAIASPHLLLPCLVIATLPNTSSDTTADGRKTVNIRLNLVRNLTEKWRTEG